MASRASCRHTRSPARRARLLHVMAENTQDLEQCLERIRATDGISRTVTEVVLSTLFER